MKFLLEVGFKTFVVDAEQAQAVWDILRDAEIYEEKRNYNAAPSDRKTTYHVYEQEELCEPVQLKCLTSRQYNMAKLAGKPEK